MAGTLSKFLKSQATSIAAQLALLRAKFGKVDQPSSEEEQAIEQILAGIDFAGWAILAGDIGPELDALAKDTSVAVLLKIGIDVESDADILHIVSADALAYARERSAEMVGMRSDELGRLVENPNARWQITDSTRDMIRGDVTQAIKEGWSNQRLAGILQDNYAFSSDRATTIARTESQKASQMGALNGYKASGVVDGKQWVTAQDGDVSEDCEENAEAGDNGDGVLALDEDYPSGDDAPPAHPNCRCVLLPWFAPQESTEQTEDEVTA